MTKHAVFAFMIGLCAALRAAPGAAESIRQVTVTGTRVHLGEIVPSAGADASTVDLGPAPAAGASRLVMRADIVAALGAKQLSVPGSVPDAVRVLRKSKHLEPSELDAIVRAAVSAKDLARGVTLAKVRADRPVDVADGWTRVDVNIPRAPKKEGTFSTVAIASLFVGDEVIARLPVPVDLSVSSEGATFDAPRGAAITLVVQRALVEVRAAGTAGADADVGDVLPVQLLDSGRVMRARLTSKDEAVAIEGVSPAATVGQTAKAARP